MACIQTLRPPDHSSDVDSDCLAACRLVILHQGTNERICFPGNENIIGDVPLTRAAAPMGARVYWMLNPYNAEVGRSEARFVNRFVWLALTRK